MYSSSKYNSSPPNIARFVVCSTTSSGCFTFVNWKVKFANTGSVPLVTNTGSTTTFVLFTSGLVPGFDGCSGFDGSSGFTSGLPGFVGPSGFDGSPGLTSGLLGTTVPSSISYETATFRLLLSILNVCSTLFLTTAVFGNVFIFLARLSFTLSNCAFVSSFVILFPAFNLST